jgi:hypothetical protein
LNSVVFIFHHNTMCVHLNKNVREWPFNFTGKKGGGGGRLRFILYQNLSQNFIGNHIFNPKDAKWNVVKSWKKIILLRITKKCRIFVQKRKILLGEKLSPIKVKRPVHYIVKKIFVTEMEWTVISQMSKLLPWNIILRGKTVFIFGFTSPARLYCSLICT